MINLKLRFQNKVTLVAILSATASLIYMILGIFNVVPPISEEQVINVGMAIINLLVLLGVVVDPTTKGVKDSARAMGYDEPADDSTTYDETDYVEEVDDGN